MQVLNLMQVKMAEGVVDMDVMTAVVVSSRFLIVAAAAEVELRRHQRKNRSHDEFN